MKVMQCATCGSRDVTRTSESEWDIQKQEWVQITVYDDATCNQCGGETTLNEEDLPPDEAALYSSDDADAGEKSHATAGGHFSKPGVMRSHAGWYIGTAWIDEDGIPMPGSRESDYFRTFDEASAALKAGSW